MWAQAANGVIGRDNALPWHLPEDMAHFRELTRAATVVMGRLTWQSLPPRVRPLPGRFNIVLSRDAGWAAEGATTAADFADALQVAASSTLESDIWVIGGASVYQAAMPYADRLVVTELGQEFDGDVHAPVLGPEWGERTATPPWLTSSNGLAYRIRDYRR